MGVSAARFREISAAEAGLPVPGGRRVGHLHAECGRRNRRGSFSRKGEIGFPSIYEVVSETLSKMPARQLRRRSATFWRWTGNRGRWRASWWPRGPRGAGDGVRLICMVFVENVLWLLVLIGVMINIHEAGPFLGGPLFRCQGRGLQLRVRPAPVRLPARRDGLPVFADSVRRLRENGRRARPAATRARRRRSAQLPGQAALAAADHRLRRAVHEHGAGGRPAHRPLHGEVPEGVGRRICRR